MHSTIIASGATDPRSPVQLFLEELGLEEHRSALKDSGFRSLDKASRMSADNLVEFKDELANRGVNCDHFVGSR